MLARKNVDIGSLLVMIYILCHTKCEKRLSRKIKVYTVKLLYYFLALITTNNYLFPFIPSNPYIPWLNCAQQLAMNVPTALGKTHFILGYTPEKETKVSSTPIDAKQTYVTNNSCALFTPDDDVRSQLISLIDQEKEAIKIAVFMFTDKNIANALLNAHNRNIKIEIVTDPAGLRDRQNKIGLLSDNKIAVYVYNGQHGKNGSSSIMHHKFILFSKNKNTKPLLWTGSFNFTRIACDCNQENVVILDDLSLIEKYSEQFNRLKKRSYRYKPGEEE